MNEIGDDLDDLLLEAFSDDRQTVSAPDDLKQTQGRYRLYEEIGRGGQGVVHRAHDLHLDRCVALKILTRLLSSTDRRLERFQREARVASRLNHPGICPVFDFGSRHGVPYITMPLLEGESLAAKIARARWESHPNVTLPAPEFEVESGSRTTSLGSTDVAAILRFIEKVALALHSAHEAGIVHRDVKPGNIMVAADGEPVLLDFGLALDFESETATLTKSGEFLGTPAYMSPEQLDSTKGEVDRRTDVYALGAVLFEALTLRRPFGDGTSRSPRVDAHPPDPRRYRTGLPRDLGVAIATALDPDPARRYSTALAFAEDIRRILSRKPILARPAGRLLRLQRWLQRNPAQTIAGAALALGLIASLFFLGTARSARDFSERHLAEWQVLADAGRARQLLLEANRDLWPATPDKISAMHEWLRRAEALTARLPRHQEILASLRQRSRPVQDAAPPGAHARGPEDLSSNREAWQFDDPADRWRHGQELALIDDLQTLASEDPHGPTVGGIRRRLAMASTLERAVSDSAEWDRVRRDVSNDPRFEGLSLEPQLGLVPLGRDADSGLEEFAALPTGDVPVRDPATGRLIMTEESALILVLVPGGTGWMGAQCDDPKQPHYIEPGHLHPSTIRKYGPVHQVELAPFFVSKFEMTQRQWLHMIGNNPSANPAGSSLTSSTTWLHPVEAVTWDDCLEVLPRFSCQLPTEAQWEYACRASTRTTWSTGNTEASLSGYMNLADETAARTWKGRRPIVPGLDDGFMGHAPVGSFLPNPWGLHDMHGNVWEICLDAGSYESPTSLPDGRREPGNVYHHTTRGGSFVSPAPFAATATRNFLRREYVFYDTGVRPVRMLDVTR